MAKVTKTDIIVAINALVDDENLVVEVGDVEVTGSDIKAYCSDTLLQLTKKAEKARERAAEKKAEGDELREQIYGLLTEGYQSADEITAQINDEDISKSKVVARLTQLVKAEMAVKEQQKTEGGRKVMMYKLA